MKKIVLSMMFFLGAGMVMKSKAQCQFDLPAQLQNCFDELSPGALTVIVMDSSLYITGTLDPSFRDAAQACIDQYNAASASCPGAPVIVYDIPPVTGYDSNTGTTLPTATYARYKRPLNRK